MLWASLVSLSFTSSGRRELLRRSPRLPALHLLLPHFAFCSRLSTWRGEEGSINLSNLTVVGLYTRNLRKVNIS